jgi:hypothetical protein
MPVAILALILEKGSQLGVAYWPSVVVDVLSIKVNKEGRATRLIIYPNLLARLSR